MHPPPPPPPALPCMTLSAPLQCPDLQDGVRLLPVHVEAPAAWHDLAAGVAAHGASALHAALAPRRLRVPSFGTLAHCGCHLTSTTVARRFRSRQLNACLALLFEQAPAAAALAGLPPIELSRWDLHHGHLFYERGSAQLGLLLHAREYPAATADFDVCLGNCQAGGAPPYEQRAQQLRNLLWWVGWGWGWWGWGQGLGTRLRLLAFCKPTHPPPMHLPASTLSALALLPPFLPPATGWAAGWRAWTWPPPRCTRC